MGRPREFCLHEALERALEVFWRRGFEGASLAELTAAMGITKPSLYASYGNKETLFRKALDLYDREHMGFMREALGKEHARDVAEAILLGTVRATASDAMHPPGCLSVNGALACSVAADPIKRETARRRQLFQEELASRFEQDKARGDLPENSKPSVLASFVMTFGSGLAFQASMGASSSELFDTVAIALCAWPVSGKRARHALEPVPRRQRQSLAAHHKLA